MDLTFNELSFRPFAEDTHILIEKFRQSADTLKLVRERYGFSHLIFPHDLGKSMVLDGVTFYEWVNAIPNQGEKNRILALIKRPFVNEVLKEQMSDLDAFYFESETLGIEQVYCDGLATAHIAEGAALSLHTHSYWEQDEIKIFKQEANENSAGSVNVYNVCLVSGFNEKLGKYFDSIAAVDLIETHLTPDEKTHSFRDDHGTDILVAFAKRLKNSGHVVAIINSLPFNSQTTQFIRRIYSDGKLEIVLHWEDKGYGMVVQTTGRNLRETKAIAKLLKDKYDR